MGHLAVVGGEVPPGLQLLLPGGAVGLGVQSTQLSTEYRDEYRIQR